MRSSEPHKIAHNHTIKDHTCEDFIYRKNLGIVNPTHLLRYARAHDCSGYCSLSVMIIYGYSTASRKSLDGVMESDDAESFKY